MLPRDAAILAVAEAGIAALNARHEATGAGRVFLFHRQRQWNAREGRWMGWERKRGKIEEPNLDHPAATLPCGRDRHRTDHEREIQFGRA